MIVYTIDQKIVELCETPLKSGGEGAIYELVAIPALVAKVYHDISEAKKREEKILEMIKIGNSKEFHLAHIGHDIAWPLFPLYNSNNQFIGFLMPKISAQYELDDLYTYPPNKNTHITMKNKIDALISLCDTMERLHSIGQIFGDFNPDNVKLKNDFTVTFVDADSYHIFGSEKLYKCTVCAPGYVAPELVKACKGTTYADVTGTTFTVETDHFSLALHCFQMLMNGCHPFAWQRTIKSAGSVPAPKNLDLRVADGQTPFFQYVSQYTVPDFAPDLTDFPPYLYNMFERAFVDGHDNPQVRPSASEWKDVLITYQHELNDCVNNPNHSHWNQISRCPYCEADARATMALNTSLKSTNNSMFANGNLIRNTATQNTRLTPSFFPVIANKSLQKRRVLFWTVTFLLTASFSGLAWLDNGHWSFFVGGLCGTFLYNLRIDKKHHTIRWYCYIFSFLWGIAGASVPALISYIIPILIIIVFLAGLLS